MERKKELEKPEKITQEDAEKRLDDAEAFTNNELANIIGMESIKEEITNILDVVRGKNLLSVLEKGEIMKYRPTMVFKGNPGVGKTFIAETVHSKYE